MRNFDQQWLSLTFSKAVFLGNGLVAIIAGLFGNLLVDTLALGPVAPFDASSCFLAIEYSREEILGRNCRFLQGLETDPATVKKIRNAIDNQTDVTVQLISYTKSGKKFWNVFHLQPMRDQTVKKATL